MKERYLWKVKCTLEAGVAGTVKRDFFVASKQGLESEAKKVAEGVIAEEWGDEWAVDSYEEFEYIGRVYTDVKVDKIK